MGWLHDGHRALMQRARADDRTVVVTIFVNPRQFGDPADLAQYPRNEARDLEICEAEGVDIVFAPSVEEVYPPGFDTTVKVGAIAEPLEGRARPGHFDGVATVVAILFGLVRAERAYFGQKDAQQVAVIRRMALDLAIPTEVVACPTVREPDGLATVVAQRPPVPGRAGRGAGAPRGAPRGPRGMGGRRAFSRGAPRADVGPSSPRSRWRTSSTSPAPTPPRSRSSTSSIGRRCCRSPCASDRPGSSTTSRCPRSSRRPSRPRRPQGCGPRRGSRRRGA